MPKDKYTLIVRSHGDGSSDYGARVVFHDFNNRRAAELAMKFLDQNPNISTLLVEDHPQ